jgi:hypothetical protein
LSAPSEGVLYISFITIFAFASGLSDGRTHDDVTALEVDRFPRQPLAQFGAAHTAKRNQRNVRQKIFVSRIQ